MDEGRCAVTHWGMVPHFGGDWQVWQKTERELFGAEPWLDFHRYGPSFGFAPVPAGASFEGLNEAPQDDQYQTRSVPATPGLLLFCRVHGNGPQDRCYGKLLVEGVTETPPAGVRAIKSSHDE
jgi:hypothetical protein